MKLRILLALSIVLPATAALAAEGTFDRTFAVSGSPSVSVASGSGYIHVYPGSGNQVHIVGHVHSDSGWSGADADARVKEIVASPPIAQSGDTITVSALPNGDSGLFRHISIDYDVATPRATALKARTGSGSIEIGGIETAIIATSGSGSIHTDNIGAGSASKPAPAASRPPTSTAPRLSRPAPAPSNSPSPPLETSRPRLAPALSTSTASQGNSAPAPVPAPSMFTAIRRRSGASKAAPAASTFRSRPTPVSTSTPKPDPAPSRPIGPSSCRAV